MRANRPVRDYFPELIVVLLAVLLICSMFAGCVRPPAPTPELQPGMLRAAAAAAGALPPETPAIRFLYGRTSCVWNGPNPVVVPQGLPRVGAPVVVRWQLSAVPPPPTLVDPDGVTSPPPVVLLGSTRPLEAAIPAGAAAPGCWLLVPPDFSIVPAPETWLTYDTAKGIVEMRWTPTPGMEGSELYLQLVAAIPGANPLGLVSSAGLYLRIGTEL